jgi:hypothetical protein
MITHPSPTRSAEESLHPRMIPSRTLHRPSRPDAEKPLIEERRPDTPVAKIEVRYANSGREGSHKSPIAPTLPRIRLSRSHSSGGEAAARDPTAVYSHLQSGTVVDENTHPPRPAHRGQIAERDFQLPRPLSHDAVAL